MAFQFIVGVDLQENIPPRLKALEVDPAEFTFGKTEGTVLGAIRNKTSGSTLAITPADDRVAIFEQNIAIGTEVAEVGSFDITLRETLAGAIGNPRDTVITITVNPV